MDAVLTNTKITVPTAKLQDLVSRAIKASTGVDVIPLTTMLQLQVKDNTLTVTCTDNTNYAITTMDTQNPDFHVVVNAQFFANLLSKITTTTISFSVEGNKLTIVGNGTYNTSIETDNGQPIFINPPEVTPNGSTIHVEKSELASILTYNKTCKAVGKEIPALYNYYFDTEASLTTDTFKCCYNPIVITDRSMILTPMVVDLLGSICDEGGIDIQQNDESLIVSSTIGTLYAKKSSTADLEAFPALDLKELLANNFSTTITVNRTLLLQAAERMALFTNTYEQNKLQIVFEADHIVLHNEESNSTESVNYIGAATGYTEPIGFQIDLKSLKDMLSCCTTEELIIGIDAQTGIQLNCGNIKMVLGQID